MAKRGGGESDYKKPATYGEGKKNYREETGHCPRLE